MEQIQHFFLYPFSISFYLLQYTQIYLTLNSGQFCELEGH
jgi:hypothetical protein